MASKESVHYGMLFVKPVSKIAPATSCPHTCRTPQVFKNHLDFRYKDHKEFMTVRGRMGTAVDEAGPYCLRNNRWINSAYKPRPLSRTSSRLWLS